MKVSQRVHASALEELNLAGDNDNESKTVLIVKDMMEADKQKLTALLKQYKDVFAWSFDDMKGLDPTFCQHQINLHRDAKPVQQRRYRLNPNYAIKVKEEIGKPIYSTGEKINMVKSNCGGSGKEWKNSGMC